MNVPLLDLKQQYQQIKDDILPAISAVCESQMLCLGPAVAEFEKKIANYCGCKYAIGVSSGSDALLVSLMALGIKSGDEVITTPFTFFATAGAIARLGAKPVFVDIEPDFYNIDPAKIEKKITKKTKGIIPVHLYGQVSQMKPIMQISKAHNLFVIEDACQSIGAAQNDIQAGNFGNTGCFSFYPTKNLGAFGDGGLVTTNDEKLAEKLRVLRDHGQNPRYYYNMIGGNFRLDGIQGATLNVKLNHLNKWTEKRRQNAATYNKLLAGCPVKTPKVAEGNKHIYHQYTIAAPKRDQLQKFLADSGISSAIFYPKPLHLQQCFSNLGYKASDMPIAEKVCEEVLSLPIYPELTEEQIKYTAAKICEFYGCG